MCTAVVTANSQNPSDMPLACSITWAASATVWFACSVTPFCCGIRDAVNSCCVPLSVNVLHPLEIGSHFFSILKVGQKGFEQPSLGTMQPLKQTAKLY